MNLNNKLKFKSIKANKFVCALCHTERSMKHQRNLSKFNYLQLTLLLIVTSYLLFPVIGMKVLALNLLLWITVEFSNKLLYRKELPCKLCGFDALWYRRDPQIARKKVEACIQRAKENLVVPKSNNQDQLDATTEASSH